MWLIYKKEILEMLRDRRTLIISILLPTVIFPLILFGIGKFSADKNADAKNQVIKVAFINMENYDSFKQLFSKEKSFEKVTLSSNDYKNEVLNGAVDFIFIAEKGTKLPSQTQQTEAITLHYKSSTSLGKVLYSRVNEVVASFQSLERRALGVSLNISNSALKAINMPLSIDKMNYATKREATGEIAGFFVAYILIGLAVAGAMYPAMEIGVGEKERGTLETLLLSPVPKKSIVLGKFLVVFTTSFISVVVTLLSYFLWAMIFTFGGKALGVDFLSNISGLDLILVGTLLIPLTAIFASILLACSIYAKNMKEAQALMTPVMLLGFLPVMVTLIPGVSLTWKTALIPVTNVALAMKDLIKGTVNYELIAVLLVSTILIAGGLLYFVTQFFKKEKVLFRS